MMKKTNWLRKKEKQSYILNDIRWKKRGVNKSVKFEIDGKIKN